MLTLSRYYVILNLSEGNHAPNTQRIKTMTKRLEILKKSLEKKTDKFDEKLKERYDLQRLTNGQPMNDKRNGAAFFKKCEQKEESLRSINNEIEKTKKAIEKEEFKIDGCKNTLDGLPDFLNDFLTSGAITQWRKFPNRFFVTGGGKARIIFEADKKTKELKLFHSHYNRENCTQEEGQIFKNVYNEIYSAFHSSNIDEAKK